LRPTLIETGPSAYDAFAPYYDDFRCVRLRGQLAYISWDEWFETFEKSGLAFLY
jgi:hypothetical protein